MFHKTEYKTTKSIYIILLTISLIYNILLITYNYISSCHKYVIWNEVIFLSLLYCFTINICLHNLKDKKNWIEEYKFSKHSIYFVFCTAFTSTAIVMTISNINKLINC